MQLAAEEFPIVINILTLQAIYDPHTLTKPERSTRFYASDWKVLIAPAGTAVRYSASSHWLLQNGATGGHGYFLLLNLAFS